MNTNEIIHFVDVLENSKLKTKFLNNVLYWSKYFQDFDVINDLKSYIELTNCV